jgi:2,3-bisphosphoglycerate-independent phosphoglycerate mutase
VYYYILLIYDYRAHDHLDVTRNHIMNSHEEASSDIDNTMDVKPKFFDPSIALIQGALKDLSKWDIQQAALEQQCLDIEKAQEVREAAREAREAIQEAWEIAAEERLREDREQERHNHEWEIYSIKIESENPLVPAYAKKLGE